VKGADAVALFDVYVVTVFSRTRGERSPEPVGQIDAGAGRGVSERLRKEAHKKFGLAANQYATFLHAKSKKQAQVVGETAGHVAKWALSELR
jgi:hypothetical protein